MEPARFLLGSGALFAFLGVAAGAFGAHALKERLDAYSLGVWNTAVQYQMYHALSMVALAALAYVGGAGPSARVAGWCFGIGILVFSGSLYLLALTGIKWLGAFTPVGGLLFLVGWIVVVAEAFRR